MRCTYNRRRQNAFQKLVFVICLVVLCCPFHLTRQRVSTHDCIDECNAALHLKRGGPAPASFRVSATAGGNALPRSRGASPCLAALPRCKLRGAKVSQGRNAPQQSSRQTLCCRPAVSASGDGDGGGLERATESGAWFACALYVQQTKTKCISETGLCHLSCCSLLPFSSYSPESVNS